MFVHVLEAKYVHDYAIWIRFDNGVEGNVDLSAELWGEVFEPLKELSVFKKFHVDAEINTIVWDNGADIAPDFLLSLLQNRKAA